MHTKKGFTLIEMVASVAIIALIAVIAIQPLRSFRDEQLLTSHAERVSTLLNEARLNTLASRNASQYGVYIENTEATLFEGVAFASADSVLETLSFHTQIETGSVNLEGGGNTVVFERLTGSTANKGSIVLQLTHNASSTRTIVIEETGIVTVHE